MTLEIMFMYGLVTLVFVAFVWEKYPPEVIALAASAALIATGIIETKEFLSVFSNSASITIAMMFIISASLERTGVIHAISKWLIKSAKKSLLKALFMMMLLVILMSAFMNNTPIVIMLTPAIISLAAAINVAPSKLLIPLSFATIFGGTLTLIGTSSNILMDTIATDAGQSQISMFEMTLPGLIFAAVGILYMLTIGRWLLPDRYSMKTLIGSQKPKMFVAELTIAASSAWVGKKLTDIKMGEDIVLLDLLRGVESLKPEIEELLLVTGDRILIQGDASALMKLSKNKDFQFHTKANQKSQSFTNNLMFEASININSSLKGKTVQELNNSHSSGFDILAVHRNEFRKEQQFDKLKLKFADNLIISGTAEQVKLLLDDGDVINLSEPQDRSLRKHKAPLAILVIISIMLLSAFNVLPIAGLTLIGAVVVMMTRCVDPDEAFKAINWNILFIIFGMLGLSLGLQKTGAADYLVNSLVVFVDDLGPWWTLLLIYALTSLLTEIVSNNAVAALIGPIAIALALQLGYDTKPFVIAVMFASSASFATPIGYQTNTFVYGAGGYKFIDFVKVGLPLNIIFALVAMLIIPWFFPF